MKVAIAYYSQHHGNTKKLLDAIKDLADVELINVVECKKEDLSYYDLIGFASGIYFGKFSKAVMEFAITTCQAINVYFLLTPMS